MSTVISEVKIDGDGSVAMSTAASVVMFAARLMDQYLERLMVGISR